MWNSLLGTNEGDGGRPRTHVCEQLGLAADPENRVLSDGWTRWIIDDIVSTTMEVDLLIDRCRAEHETWYLLVLYRLGLDTLLVRRQQWKGKGIRQGHPVIAFLRVLA